MKRWHLYTLDSTLCFILACECHREGWLIAAWFSLGLGLVEWIIGISEKLSDR